MFSLEVHMLCPLCHCSDLAIMYVWGEGVVWNCSASAMSLHFPEAVACSFSTALGNAVSFSIQDDRSLINLHLMHTSYFLFVMVITMFCYAVIRGRPIKLRQSSSEFCPEKVSAKVICGGANLREGVFASLVTIVILGIIHKQL